MHSWGKHKLLIQIYQNEPYIKSITISVVMMAVVMIEISLSSRPLTQLLFPTWFATATPLWLENCHHRNPSGLYVRCSHLSRLREQLSYCPQLPHNFSFLGWQWRSSSLQQKEKHSHLVPGGHCQLGHGLWQGESARSIHQGVTLSEVDYQADGEGGETLCVWAGLCLPFGDLLLGYLVPIFCNVSSNLVIKHDIAKCPPCMK